MIRIKNKFFLLSLFLILILFIFLAVYSYFEGENEMVLANGKHYFPKGLIVPEGEILTINPGAQIIMGRDTLIEVKGRIIAKGNVNNRILFTTEDEYWRGIKILGVGDVPDPSYYWRMIEEKDAKILKDFSAKIDKPNTFDYVDFERISTKTRKLSIANKWKSSIEVYNSSILVSNSSFSDVLNIGAILTQRSFVVINNNIFNSSSMHKVTNFTDNSILIAYDNFIDSDRKKNVRCADGLWINKSMGIIYNNRLEGISDDAIDSDSSFVLIAENNINSTFDDGIDIDNKGLAYILRNRINNVAENGILISDQSKAILYDNVVINSSRGLAVRDGANVEVLDSDFKDNDIGVLVFQDILCALNEVDYKQFIFLLNSLSNEEVLKMASLQFTSAKDFSEEVEKYYEKNNNYFYLKDLNFSKISDFKILKEAFKVSDIFKYEFIEDEVTRNNKFCSVLNNSLFVLNSSLSGNIDNISLNHNFSFNFEDATLDDEREEKNLLKSSDKNLSPSMINGFNVELVENNLRKIILSL